jgi:thiol-disulfide isomerase/thioredoxin
MWARLSILIGLVAGIATAALVLGGILAFAPEPVPAATPVPSLTTATPTPTVAPSVAPSDSPAASASASSDAGAPFMVGETAPDLVVPQVGGGTIDLANLRGQPVWVDFMGTDCVPCEEEFPLMNGFAARYAADGLVVLAIDVKGEEGVVARFADSLDTTFPLGLDADGTAADRWGASAALPTHFWIDKEGIVRDGARGGIGPDVMARGVQSILPDVTVTP